MWCGPKPPIWECLSKVDSKPARCNCSEEEFDSDSVVHAVHWAAEHSLRHGPSQDSPFHGGEPHLLDSPQKCPTMLSIGSFSDIPLHLVSQWGHILTWAFKPPLCWWHSSYPPISSLTHWCFCMDLRMSDRHVVMHGSQSAEIKSQQDWASVHLWRFIPTKIKIWGSPWTKFSSPSDTQPHDSSGQPTILPASPC